MARLIGRYVLVALLVAGSAILLFSCDKPPAAASGGDEALMTEYSEHLSVIMSENGRRSYFFKAPLLEGYTLVKEPYREFRKGIEITTYQDDSLTTVDAVLTANYAIYYENRKLWEAKGDVVVVKSDGKTLYTQQLFWNAKTQRIYSNVDTKIVQNEGGNVFQGEGFESDEAFKEWRFRRFTGKMDVDVSQEDDEPSESEAADGEDRPAGEKTPQSATRPPAGSAPAPAAAGERGPAGSVGKEQTVAGRESAPETGGKPAAGSEAAAIVSNPAAEGNPAGTVKKGQPAAAEHKRAAEAGGKPAAGSGAAVPGETPTGEKTPDNGDPAPAALSPQTDEPQTEA